MPEMCLEGITKYVIDNFTFQAVSVKEHCVQSKIYCKGLEMKRKCKVKPKRKEEFRAC